jgi:hypothetical protein
MAQAGTELFVLYQMGASEEWTWYSVVGVFLSEAALRDHAKKKGITSELRVMVPDAKGGVTLTEPQEYVAVRSVEGPVPDVELNQPDCAP